MFGHLLKKENFIMPKEKPKVSKATKTTSSAEEDAFNKTILGGGSDDSQPDDGLGDESQSPEKLENDPIDDAVSQPAPARNPGKKIYPGCRFHPEKAAIVVHNQEQDKAAAKNGYSQERSTKDGVICQTAINAEDMVNHG